MLKFNINSLKAVAKFFQYRNDIDIYTEDNIADKEFYRSLFKRLFDNQIVINDITPLGCKADVIEEAKNNNLKIGRKKYFIIDGDLDLIIDNNPPSIENLIVLDSYCIENYLIDEEAMVELIYYNNGTQSKEIIREKLGYNQWLGDMADPLINLFLNFAILRKYNGGPEIKNANFFLNNINKTEALLCEEKIELYNSHIKNEVINRIADYGFDNPENIYQKEYEYLSNKWPILEDTLLKIVSGKNYLIPLLQYKIRSQSNSTGHIIPTKSIKLFLVNNCKLDRLDFIRHTIVS